MHLELSGPTRRPSVHLGAQRVPEEDAAVVELAEAGEAVVEGEIAEPEETKVVTVTIARRMAGTNRQAKSGREAWSRMAETTPGCAGKRYLPSCQPPHQKSQRRTAESREYIAGNLH
jgi:hypothetical protein